MIRLGLIGFPLGHSLSRRLHERALEVLGMEGRYDLWEVPPLPEGREALFSRLEALREGRVAGINVTIPHKESILPYVDHLTPTAQAIGAVNTLWFDSQAAQLVGENTDSPGFWADVQKLLPEEWEGENRQALILGAGGGARAAAHALLTHGWLVSVAARRISQAEEISRHLGDSRGEVKPCLLSEDILPELETCRLIVNATPVGMVPDIKNSPWPHSWEFPKEAVVYDLVYNPARTCFMQQAEAQGLKARNGLGMLVEQAALAFQCWTDREPPRGEMFKAIR